MNEINFVYKESIEGFDKLLDFRVRGGGVGGALCKTLLTVFQQALEFGGVEGSAECELSARDMFIRYPSPVGSYGR